MNESTTQNYDAEATLSIDRARRVNDACDRFELAWRAGSRPKIEAFLNEDEFEDAGQRVLFRELVALELELRREGGELPNEDDYLARFPGEADLIADSFQSCSPDRIGDYEILGELGRGGMGVVYRARQCGLDRQVAVKVLRIGRLASEAESRRFRVEARAAAGLRHQNIVKIIDVGCWHGEHYFSMELIEGGTLTRVLSPLRDDPRAAARLLLKITKAVAHAHELGFVHRDLKPGNILLDGDPSMPVTRREPYIADFGLVMRVGPGSEERPSRSEGIAGTIEYMAPEQATAGLIDERTDVYGLGAVLFAMLTGRPPHRADSPMEALVQVAEREPDPPRRLNPHVPRNLEAICLRCLEKDPEHRYPSAEALANDLELFLREQPITAGRVGPYHFLRRWVGREPELAFRLIGVGLITILTQVNYVAHIPANRDPVLHLEVTAVELIWMALAASIQVIARRSDRPERLAPAWIIVDVLALTLLLGLLQAAESALVIGYPLLVIASGLWSQRRLVWATAGLSIAGYLWLWLVGANSGDFRPLTHLNITIASLIVTAMLVAHQVRRLRSLSRFYEQLPDPR